MKNYSMLLILNTTAAGGFKANGDDVRIVYWNGTNHVELDRYNDSGFNKATTNIWFRIQTNIISGSYTDNYY